MSLHVNVAVPFCATDVVENAITSKSPPEGASFTKLNSNDVPDMNDLTLLTSPSSPSKVAAIKSAERTCMKFPSLATILIGSPARHSPVDGLISIVGFPVGTATMSSGNPSAFLVCV